MRNKTDILKTLATVESTIDCGVAYSKERTYLEGVYVALCWVLGFKNEIRNIEKRGNCIIN